MVEPSKEGVAVVERAYEFSKKAHSGQTRYSNEPYFVHPAATAKILAEYGMDATTIAAGLLHDAVEDDASRARRSRRIRKGTTFYR